MRIFFRTLFFLGFLFFSMIIGCILYVNTYQPLNFDLLSTDVGKPTVVLDVTGKELFRFAKDKREPILLKDVPQVLIDAFIAAEDWQFFHHNGISLRGIVRSLVVNVINGRKAQGASTITQQLVRLLYFDTHKTFSRKVREQIYAVLLERSCTKEQILESYINTVYFGLGIYGVQAACQRFWGKSVEHITVDEAACLAGVVCSPKLYCPVWAPLSAKRRRNIVLQQMRKCGFLTEAECNNACECSVETYPEKDEKAWGYVKELVRQFLEKRYGKQAVYSGGLTVHTTFNFDDQERAARFFTDHCTTLRTKISSAIDGGMVVVDNSSGAIRTLVGGYDFSKSQYNRVTQARRQMGSTFKPIVYAAALLDGHAMSEVLVDEPIDVTTGNQIWSPRNYNDRFDGPMTLAYALSRSINTITVQTLLNVGVERVVMLAQKCRLPAQDCPYPSLALGCLDVNLLEVASLYSMFAYAGIYHEPYFVGCVTDGNGAILFKHASVAARVLPSYITGQIVSVLQLGMQRMQANKKQGFRIETESMSKTGTTNDARTCWFVGSTPDVTAALYIGCDDNRSMGRNVYPVETAFPIWYRYMATIPQYDRTTFFVDPALHKIVINERTGDYSSPDLPEAISLLVK